MAAIDDARGDPRRLRALARRPRVAAARRRRGVPLRIRLARRHQRHARDDRVQLEERRLPQDPGGARADADAGDPGRARREDQALRLARLLGSARRRSASRPANTPAAGSTKISRRTSATKTVDLRAERLWDEARAHDITRPLRRAARRDHRREQSRRRSSRRCFSISRACSARRTAASASRRA